MPQHTPKHRDREQELRGQFAAGLELDAELLGAYLDGAAIAFQDLTPAERGCISAKIRKIVGEGKPENQAVAIAFKECAPGKARPSKREANGVSLSYAVVQELCPECAAEMNRRGLSALKLDSEGAEKVLRQARDPAAVCGALWARGTDKQRGAFGRGTEGKGRDEKPPKAWFDDCLDKIAGSSAAVAAESKPEDRGPLPDLPGGKYTARQNPNGTWDVFDVALFAEHDVVKRDGTKFHVGRSWMQRAIAHYQRRELLDDYLPPLHINHHFMNENVEEAGFYRLRQIKRGAYEGKPVWMLHGDLVELPDSVYQRMRNARLAYRSVEIHNLHNHEIDSLAVMAHKVPFFRLPLLTIGTEIPLSMGAVQEASESQPALAYRALGDDGVRLLTCIDGVCYLNPTTETETHMKKYQNEEQEREEEAPEESPPEEEEKEEEEEMPEAAGDGNGKKVAERIMDMIAGMQSLVDELMGEKAEPEEAPAPVEMAAKPTKNGKSYSSSADVKVLARLDKAESTIAAMTRREKVEKAVSKATEELTGLGYDAATIETRLRELAGKKGESLDKMYGYVAAAKELGEPDPSPHVPGTATRSTLDPSAQAYSALGPDRLQKALLYANEYEEMKGAGMNFDFSKEDHVKMCMEADGVQVPASAGGEKK